MLLVIIFLIIILIIYLIYCYIQNNNNNNKDEFNLYSSWNGYRLGDIVGGAGGTEPIKQLHNNKLFDNSIAKKYLEQCNNVKGDYKLLTNIVHDHCKSNNQNNQNTCIVHLRTGDIFDSWWSTMNINKINKMWNDELYDTKSMFKYYFSKNHYLQKIDKLNKINIQNIIILAGSHYKDDQNKNIFPNSSHYINLVKNLFQNNGFNVELRLGNIPDDDVCLVYNNKYFLPSKGQFTKILTKICEEKGNIII